MKRLSTAMRLLLYVFLGSSLVITSWQAGNISPRHQLLQNRQLFIVSDNVPLQQQEL